MNRLKSAAIAAGILSSGLAGGMIGAFVTGANAAATTVSVAPAAATTTAATSPSAATTAAPAAGAFKPNEDPTHEAGESAAREAQENAGQVPTVP